MTTVNIAIEDLENDIKLVKFEGQLDESNVDEKSKLIYSLIESTDKPQMIFDLSGLEYMNSKSIGYLNDWYLKVSDKGGKIVLAAAKENIMDILDVVGMTQILEQFPTLEQAKKAFNE